VHLGHSLADRRQNQVAEHLDVGRRFEVDIYVKEVPVARTIG
jgi:hypothetical protein